MAGSVVVAIRNLGRAMGRLMAIARILPISRIRGLLSYSISDFGGGRVITRTQRFAGRFRVGPNGSRGGRSALRPPVTPPAIKPDR